MSTTAERLFRNNMINLVLIVTLWAVTQLLAYWHFEMRQSVDTTLYIERAHALLRGDFFTGHELFYSSYIILLAIVIRAGFNPEFVIIMQLLSAVWALVSIYGLTKFFTNDKQTSLIACLLYIGWFKFQQWNLILYTDALFANMVVVSIYLLAKAKTPLSILAALLVIIFASFLRPAGIGLILAVAVYGCHQIYARLKPDRVVSLAFTLTGVALSLWLMNLVLRDFVDSFIDSYQKVEIIYPDITLKVARPEVLFVPDEHTAPLLRLLIFVFRNPFYFARISIIKGLLFLGHAKPYYSLWHNLFIVIFLYPAYYFAIRGWLSIRKNAVEVLLFVVFIVFQFFMVSFTSENWDGRFLLPVLPFVFVLAAVGFIKTSQAKLSAGCL